MVGEAGREKEFVLKRNRRQLTTFLTDVFLKGGLALLVCAGLFFKNNYFIGILLLVFYLRHFVYNRIDLLFQIRVVSKGEKIWLKFAGINWPLDKKDSFLIIEDVRLFHGKGYYYVYGLVLVRNAGVGWKRIIKNRIKLNIASELLLLPEMKIFSEATGIRYLDFFEDPFGGV